MGEFKIEQPKPVTPEAKPDFFHKIKEGFSAIEFSDEELINLFDKKYENSDMNVLIFDEFGYPVHDGEGKITLKNQKDFSDKEKILNIKSLVRGIKNNNLDYIKKLYEEKELLELASKKNSYYKQLKDIPEKSEETLKAMVEREIENNN